MDATKFLTAQRDFDGQQRVERASRDRFDALYHREWPGCVINRPTDRDLQKGGLDVVLLTVTDDVVTFDEKYRPTDYGDFLCEVWSVWGDARPPSLLEGDRGADPRNDVGWTLDARKRMDYVAYGLGDSGWCWMLPFDDLRAVATAHWRDWQRAGGWKPAATANRNYRTYNVCVEWDELLGLLGMRIDQVRYRW